jgi:hypothetical protein
MRKHTITSPEEAMDRLAIRESKAFVKTDGASLCADRFLYAGWLKERAPL